MIINLLQLGLFGGTSNPAPSGLTVPASRTILLTPKGTTNVVTGKIPPTTFIWPEAMDPYDVLDFKIDCSGLLETGESITSYTLTPRSEAVLLGLQILSNTPYGITTDGKAITLWLSVLAAEQENNSFSSGALLPIEVSITTDTNPGRKKQRTVAVRVLQQ